MTAKEFFRGKAFKCIIVILIIVLVCGIFLTICNSLFYVSDADRIARAVAKLYPDETIETEAIEDETDDVPDSVSLSSTYYTVQNVYHITTKGDYVIKVAGKNGYGGNVTCWVVVIDDGEKVTGLGTVLAQSSENTGESFLSNLTDDDFERFSAEYEDGIVYDYGFSNEGSTNHGEGYVATGASKSYRGVCNAVNGAIEFVNNYLEYLAENPAETGEEVAA